jgi:hypothetical protein
MSEDREYTERETFKKRMRKVESDSSSPAENASKEAYDSVDNSED